MMHEVECARRTQAMHATNCLTYINIDFFVIFSILQGTILLHLLRLVSTSFIVRTYNGLIISINLGYLYKKCLLEDKNGLQE